MVKTSRKVFCDIIHSPYFHQNVCPYKAMSRLLSRDFVCVNTHGPGNREIFCLSKSIRRLSMSSLSSRGSFSLYGLNYHYIVFIGQCLDFKQGSLSFIAHSPDNRHGNTLENTMSHVGITYWDID